MALAALILLGVFAVGVSCFGFQLLRQHGRILTRLEALETSLEQGAQASSLAKSRLKRDGLTAGTPAPDFRIPRLDGGELSLSEYLGRRVVLVFSDPQCGPCMTLAPRLERQSRRTGTLVLMVSRGDEAANRVKVAEHRLTFPVGLQRHWEVSLLYGMFATPIAYLVDENGIIAAPVATGPDRVLALMAQAAPGRTLMAVGA